MPDSLDDLIRKLDRLLDEEREILLTGELDRLSDLLAEKEHLIDSLNAADAEPTDDLRRTSEKTLRNQALLQEALAGIRNVARKLGEMRQARRSFDTYDKLGHRMQVASESQSSVEKRA